jgi:hypothetical protein
MLTLDRIQILLADRQPKSVAVATGLSYDTVWRVKRGETKAISYDVVKKLSDYLQGITPVEK